MEGRGGGEEAIVERQTLSGKFISTGRENLRTGRQSKISFLRLHDRGKIYSECLRESSLLALAWET